MASQDRRGPGKVRRITNVVLNIDETMEQVNELLAQMDGLMPELAHQLKYLNETLNNINNSLERVNNLADNADWMLSPAQNLRKRPGPRPGRTASRGEKTRAGELPPEPEALDDA